MAAPPSASELTAHVGQLRRYARALTGDSWAADDLVQDTLERACSRWGLWRAGSDLRAWLFTLMHNLFVDHARRALRRPTEPLDEPLLDTLAQEAGTEQALDLQRCLMRLPDEQREVLLLVTLQDLDYAEVARVTGVPIGTVMSRLSRARARLRDMMEGHGRAPAQDPRRPALRRMK